MSTKNHTIKEAFLLGFANRIADDTPVVNIAEVEKQLGGLQKADRKMINIAKLEGKVLLNRKGEPENTGAVFEYGKLNDIKHLYNETPEVSDIADSKQNLIERERIVKLIDNAIKNKKHLIRITNEPGSIDVLGHELGHVKLMDGFINKLRNISPILGNIGSVYLFLNPSTRKYSPLPLMAGQIPTIINEAAASKESLSDFDKLMIQENISDQLRKKAMEEAKNKLNKYLGTYVAGTISSGINNYGLGLIASQIGKYI
jgi:hypothetical protein